MTDNDIIEAELIDDEPDDEDKPSGKGFAKLIVRSSVKFVLASSIASIAPEAETRVQKAKLAIGTYVLADMVARSTGPYVETKIEAWKEDIRQTRILIKKVNDMVKNIEEDPSESSVP